MLRLDVLQKFTHNIAFLHFFCTLSLCFCNVGVLCKPQHISFLFFSFFLYFLLSPTFCMSLCIIVFIFQLNCNTFTRCFNFCSCILWHISFPQSAIWFTIFCTRSLVLGNLHQKVTSHNWRIHFPSEPVSEASQKVVPLLLVLLRFWLAIQLTWCFERTLWRLFSCLKFVSQAAVQDTWSRRPPGDVCISLSFFPDSIPLLGFSSDCGTLWSAAVMMFAWASNLYNLQIGNRYPQMNMHTQQLGRPRLNMHPQTNRQPILSRENVFFLKVTGLLVFANPFPCILDNSVRHPGTGGTLGGPSFFRQG